MPEISPEDRLKLAYIEKQLKSDARDESDKNFLAGVKRDIEKRYKPRESL